MYKMSILVFVLLLGCAWLQAAMFQGGVGLDAWGNQVSTIGTHNTSRVTTVGVSPYLEGFAHLSQANRLHMGFGAQYQVPRTAKSEVGNRKYTFLPVYGVTKFEVLRTPAVPEFIVRFGYNFLSGNNDFKGNYSLVGGLFGGVGAGLVLNRSLVMEAVYEVNSGLLRHDGDPTVHIVNSQLNFSVGYRLDLTR